MSWTANLGVVKDAGDLKDLAIDLSDLPPDVDRKAVEDHVEAVKKAVSALIRSKAFGGCAVKVYASGSALPKHKPYGGKVRKFTIEKYGEEFETSQQLEPAAVEGITITLTQIPPTELEPEVVGDDAT